MPKQQPIDLLNQSFEEVIFERKNTNLFKRLTRNTHFSLDEIKAVALIIRKIFREMGSVSRTVFRDVCHAGLDFTENQGHLLVDRLFSNIIKENHFEMNIGNLVEGFSILLRGSLEERIDFAYKVYDFMGSKRLKKEHIFPLLRGCLVVTRLGEDSDELVKVHSLMNSRSTMISSVEKYFNASKEIMNLNSLNQEGYSYPKDNSSDLIDLLLKELDIDRNGKVTKTEFTEAVTNTNKLFLECMGPVFPTREARHALLTTFTHRNEQF